MFSWLGNLLGGGSRACESRQKPRTSQSEIARIKSVQQTSRLLSSPPEILAGIFSNLGHIELARLSKVSTALQFQEGATTGSSEVPWEVVLERLRVSHTIAFHEVFQSDSNIQSKILLSVTSSHRALLENEPRPPTLTLTLTLIPIESSTTTSILTLLPYVL